MNETNGFKIGDHVICNINGTIDTGWIIGEPDYGPGEHFIIANDKAIGMPANVYWLTKDGKPDVDKALQLRSRFAIEYIDAIKTTDHDGHGPDG